MRKILWINACARAESRTKRLATYLLKRLAGTVDEVDLQREGILPLDCARLAERDALLQRGETDHPMLRCAREFAEAEIIVIAAPYWDLSFPAMLKNYLEQICVTGVTFAYDENGAPYGLCKAKTLYYVTTTGGAQCTDAFGFGYVEALCRTFFGIEDVRLVAARGMDLVGADVEKILDDAKHAIDSMI